MQFRIDLVGKLFQFVGQLGVALIDIQLVAQIHLMGLGQTIQMLGAPVSNQGFGYLGFGRFDTPAGQLRQRDRVSLSGHNRLDDGLAAAPANVTQNMRKLNIHLMKGFLHELNLRGRPGD